MQVKKQAQKRWPDRILALAYGAASFSGSGSIGCRGVPVSQMRKEAVKQFGAGRVVLVDEFRTSRVSSAYSHPSEALPGQPPESFRWLLPVYSEAKRAQVRGLMSSTSYNIRFYDRDVSAALNIRRCAVGPGPRPTELCYWDGRPAMPKPGRPGQEWVFLRDKALLLAPCKPPQAPCSSQAATQPAASEPGPSTPKPAPQTGRWLDRDRNAALNMQRIGKSRWGTQKGVSCAFRDANGSPLYTWPVAPRCLSSPNIFIAKADALNQLWGWVPANGSAGSFSYSCRFAMADGRPMYDWMTVRKLWGWESGSACAYRASDGSQVSFDLLRLWAPESETPGSPHRTGPVTRHLLATSGWWWAPACKNTVSTSYAIDKVDSSLLWGSDSGSSCAFKDSNGKPLQLYDITPVCTSNTQVVRDSVGRGTCSQANLDQAATCPDLPTMDSAQVDSTGYLWGCNGASSCRYRYNGKLIYYAALLTGNWDQTPAPLPTGYGWLDSPRCAQTPTYSSSQPDAQGFPVFQQDLAAGNVASYYNDGMYLGIPCHFA
ncbi:hypothetical protein QJQ45_008446 [Haematococcus lacustris]|nr:hypothetical protein QJQ45_008446 [Haematococcus lacustris]